MPVPEARISQKTTHSSQNVNGIPLNGTKLLEFERSKGKRLKTSRKRMEHHRLRPFGDLARSQPLI